MNIQSIGNIRVDEPIWPICDARSGGRGVSNNSYIPKEALDWFLCTRTSDLTMLVKKYFLGYFY
jgi:hypothetical protein